jgi:hypothetical protein
MRIVIGIEVPPKDRTADQARWTGVVRSLPTDSGNARDSVSLGFGAWLILSENGLPLLAKVIAAAEEEKLAYHVVFSGEEEAVWGRTP